MHPLSVTPWSPGANRRRALQLFLDADEDIEESGFSELLTNAMTPPAVQKFDVRFSLAPVAINHAAVKSLGSTRRRILLERSNERNLLVGLEFMGVEACEESGATSLALDHLVRTLDTLRTRWYIRTQVQGKIAVTDKAGAEFGESLPHPFWTGQGRRRQPPSFPTHFMRTMRRIEQVVSKPPVTVSLDSSAPDRWEAARWHISRAIATWPEDRHASASHIWQGVESLAGAKGWRSLIARYMRLLPSILVDDIAGNFARQRRFCLDAGLHTDWYPWNPSRVTLETWHNRTTNRRSAKYWKTWVTAPPPFYFGENVGLLTMFRHPSMTPPPWMEKQLELSLLHLYALRNSVVHEGYRLGNGVVADHLGHLGLELLFSVIANQFADQEAVLASMETSGPTLATP